MYMIANNYIYCLVAKSCWLFWDRWAVHGIFQARILEWVAVSFPRGSSPPRNWTYGSCLVSCTAGGFFTTELRFNSWVGKIPWNRKWQPTPVFLPGKSHEQPKGHKRVGHDLATKWLNNSNNNCIWYFQCVIKEPIGHLKMLNIYGLVTCYVYSKSEYGKLMWGRKDGWGWDGEEEKTMKYYRLRKGRKDRIAEK